MFWVEIMSNASVTKTVTMKNHNIANISHGIAWDSLSTIKHVHPHPPLQWFERHYTDTVFISMKSYIVWNGVREGAVSCQCVHIFATYFYTKTGGMTNFSGL